MYNRRIIDPTNAFDKYLELVEVSEPPLLYHRWCFISCVAAAIGRNVWLPFGEDKIYPNHFITLIGPPGARKSTAIKTATKMLKESGYDYFTGDRSSKEKFIADWEHGFDKINRGIEPGSKQDVDIVDNLIDPVGTGESSRVTQAYIRAGELEDFLGSGNANFISTLTNLWDNVDSYTDRVKNTKSIYLNKPTVNMLGGATTTTFANIFSSNIIGQGMLSRMILVHGKGQRMKLTIPAALDPEKRLFIVQLLQEIRLNMHGPIELSPEAYAAIDNIYNTTGDLQDSRLATYSGRRLQHLLKLCIVVVTADLRTTLTVDDVILANSVLSYTEIYMSKALGEFGKSKNSEVSQIVYDAIADHDFMGGILATELVTLVSRDIDSIHVLTNILHKLRESGRIEQGEQRGGIPVVRIVKRQLKLTNKYTNLELLYEYRNKEAE